MANCPRLGAGSACSDGTIKFRYIAEEGDYTGFDGAWWVMSESEQQKHVRMGGRIVEWLISLSYSS